MATYLFVTNDAWFFVSHRLPIAKALSDAGHRVVVAARSDASVSKITDAGCEFVEWSISPRGKSVLGEIGTVSALFKLIKHHKPDVLHLITVKAVLYGGIVGRLLRVPCCVYAISGLGTVFASESRLAFFLRKAIVPFYRFAVGHPNARIIFQNRDDLTLMSSRLGMALDNHEIIRGSGVDPDHFPASPEPAGTPVVTMATRLLWDKGIREFIDAAELLAGKGVQARFQIAGADVAGGNPQALTAEDTQQLESSEQVRMLGHVEDIPDLFRGSNIVVLPSYREGLPKVLVEAGASARAIVTTDVPGCRDAVVEDETALLVKPQDATALANAIEDLIENDAKRRQFGLAGRKLVLSSMTTDLVVRQHLTIYQQLLAAVSSNRG